MFSRKVLAAGLAAFVIIVSGCGGNRDNPLGPDTGNETDTGNFTPNPDPGLTQPVAPAPTPAPLQNVTVQVEDPKRTGGFLFWGKKIKAQLSATNPNPVGVSATLTITFSKGGQSVETLTQSLEFAPQETKKIDVKSTKTADEVTAYATNNSQSVPGGSQVGAGVPGMPGTTGGMGGTFPGAGAPGTGPAGNGGLPY